MKKELINEIMGVPKTLDPWVRAFTDIILEMIDEEFEVGWEQEGEVTYEDPDTGEEITDSVYKTDNIFLFYEVN